MQVKRGRVNFPKSAIEIFERNPVGSFLSPSALPVVFRAQRFYAPDFQTPVVRLRFNEIPCPQEVSLWDTFSAFRDTGPLLALTNEK